MFSEGKLCKLSRTFKMYNRQFVQFARTPVEFVARLWDLSAQKYNNYSIAAVNAPCLAALFGSANFIGNLFLFLSLMEFYQFRNLCKDVRRMWPCFRGIRAGRRVRERANRCRYPIETQLTNRINHSRSSRRHRNMANCITFLHHNKTNKERGKSKFRLSYCRT